MFSPAPRSLFATLLLLLLAALCFSSCQSAPEAGPDDVPGEGVSPQEQRQALIDVSTPSGAQASWFLSLFDPVNASYQLTSEELAQHFAASFLEREDPEAILTLLKTRRAELRGLLVEEVLRDRRHDIMLRVSKSEPGNTPPSRWLLAISVAEAPPFLIEGLILERDEFDEQLHAINHTPAGEVTGAIVPAPNDHGITPSRTPSSFPSLPPEDDASP